MMATEGTPPVNQASQTTQEHYDLVCIGFGPASLAVAIALYDSGVNARVLYIERQRHFVWHAGMLLPNARMQISFLKDLATLRDPTSKFTFMNYLKSKNRLVAFTNLSTFLPLRVEYNDYMTWCADHFADYVAYGQESINVSPIEESGGPIQSWQVLSRNVDTLEMSAVTARHVIVAVGGRPKLPPGLSSNDSETRILHSSSYAREVPRLLNEPRKAYSLAVVGGGQSAAEIFNDLQTHYSNAKVTLFTGASALKPSDDSPFVNEVFDPDRVDTFYNLSEQAQQKSILSDKATNYGVVRPELLDRMYEAMYHQRLHEPDESKWQCRIVPWREVVGYERDPDSRLRLKMKDTCYGGITMTDSAFDLVMVGTGYERNAHEAILDSARSVLLKDEFAVERNYRLRFKQGAVADNCGLWLQGCCQSSHGLSDTLLSILAVRGGEMVDSIFPEQKQDKLSRSKL